MSKMNSQRQYFHLMQVGNSSQWHQLQVREILRRLYFNARLLEDGAEC